MAARSPPLGNVLLVVFFGLVEDRGWDDFRHHRLAELAALLQASFRFGCQALLLVIVGLILLLLKAL